MVALLLTVSRGAAQGDAARLGAARRVAALAVLVQAVHFGEEAATGFHRRLPELFGLDPWPFSYFVGFNLFWLGLWTVSAAGLAASRWAPLFPLWFLGVAGVVNGVAHPALALRAGGYFPGLVTSPLVAVAGVVLLSRLGALTTARDSLHG